MLLNCFNGGWINKDSQFRSSPWEPIPGRLYFLGSQLCGARRSKEEWAGCREIDSAVQSKWVEAN